jgi:hypothetical protein
MNTTEHLQLCFEYSKHMIKCEVMMNVFFLLHPHLYGCSCVKIFMLVAKDGINIFKRLWHQIAKTVCPRNIMGTVLLKFQRNMRRYLNFI